MFHPAGSAQFFFHFAPARFCVILSLGAFSLFVCEFRQLAWLPGTSQYTHFIKPYPPAAEGTEDEEQSMQRLLGLREYLDEAYGNSIFSQALDSREEMLFFLHADRQVRAGVLADTTYDLKLTLDGGGEEILPKLQVKFLCSAARAAAVTPLMKTDAQVKNLGLEPCVAAAPRNHVKNKSLYVLMREKQVVFFTLLEGEIMRGIIAGFSRYDIDLHLKGGVPVTILRHSLHDLRNKKGRSFLKRFQEQSKDWQKSDLYGIHEDRAVDRQEHRQGWPGVGVHRR